MILSNKNLERYGNFKTTNDFRVNAGDLMKYYILKVLGEYKNEKFCITDGMPKGIKGNKLALKYGGSLKDIYPENPLDVTMHLDEDSPKHIKLGSYISNTSNYVMVSKDVVEELKKYNIGEVDFWPFTLINHKGRIHSQDYSFVCPVSSFDALNENLSEIDRDANGVAIGVDKVVLDNEKLKNALDLFRINDIRLMAFSEPLVQVLQEKYTNFVFEKAEQV